MPGAVVIFKQLSLSIMHRCDHKAWVEVRSDGANRGIVYDDRLSHLLRNLKNPQRQYPSVALFLGGAKKDKALRSLFTQDFPSRRPKSNVNIYLDRRTKTSPHPLYFAEFDPHDHKHYVSRTTHPNCHRQDTTSISWTDHQDATMMDSVAARLLLPFVDLICLFASDLGDSSAVSALLKTWAQLGRHAHSLPSDGVHVIVISDEADLSAGITALQQEVDFVDTFKSIKVHQSSTRDKTALYEQVSNCLDLARNERTRRKVLFSASHQESLFRSAIGHFARTIREPFDVLGATRAISTGLGKDFVAHVKHVFDTAPRSDVPLQDVATVVASTLLLDAVSGEPHCKFIAPEGQYRALTLGCWQSLIQTTSSKSCTVRRCFSPCPKSCKTIHRQRVFAKTFAITFVLNTRNASLPVNQRW